MLEVNNFNRESCIGFVHIGTLINLVVDCLNGTPKGSKEGTSESNQNRDFSAFNWKSGVEEVATAKLTIVSHCSLWLLSSDMRNP